MKRVIVLILIIVPWLSGCAVTSLFSSDPYRYRDSSRELTSAEQQEAAILAYWIDYSLHSQHFTADERKTEYFRLKGAKSLEGKGRLVLLLASSGVPAQQEQAAKLANEQIQTAQRSKQMILANFLQLVAAQIKSQRDAQGLSAKNRQLQAQLQQQEEHANLLKKQINALKSIEKSIYEREYGFTNSAE
ncbi:MAG: hypothetical protein OEW58_01210 [Gammaproteobacteria bacterium]|nr:hypothetical protein [Gammaproteobacteria bacterium]